MNAVAMPVSGETKRRHSNIELLRIISMLFIVLHHYVYNSGLMDVIRESPVCARSALLLILGAWGKTGVNCFVLITGYFMCTSRITLKKYVKLFAEVLFYNVVTGAVFLISGYESFTLKRLVVALVPVRTIASGFVPCYLVFFLFIPFLNLLIGRMTKKQHLLLCLLSVCLYSVLPTLYFFNVSYNYVSWFAVLYLVASYVRLYPGKLSESTKLCGFASLAVFALCSLGIALCYVIGSRRGLNIEYYLVHDANKLPALLLALFTFMFFKNVRVQYSRFVNTVASSVFGVLLIHSNGDTMREWLWKNTLHVPEMFSSPYLWLHLVLSVVGVFVVCSLIDIVRIYTVEKWFMALWDKISPALVSAWGKIEGKMFSSED